MTLRSLGFIFTWRELGKEVAKSLVNRSWHSLVWLEVKFAPTADAAAAGRASGGGLGFVRSFSFNGRPPENNGSKV